MGGSLRTMAALLGSARSCEDGAAAGAILA